MLKISVQYNARKNGIEIRFSHKPGEQTRTWLKSFKFRWSPRYKVWYNKATSQAFDAIRELQTLVRSSDVVELTIDPDFPEGPRVAETATVSEDYDALFGGPV